MVKEDKLINGIKAGLIGCIAKDLPTVLLEILKLRPTYMDYGEYLVFQNINISTGTHIIGLLMEILFGIFLAVIYAHLKHLIQTNHPLFRGFVFGILIWFSTRCLITISHVKILIAHNIIMVPVNVVIAGLYGLVVSYVLEKLERGISYNG